MVNTNHSTLNTRHATLYTLFTMPLRGKREDFKMSKINFMRGRSRNLVIIYIPLLLTLFLSSLAFGALNQGTKAGIPEKVFRIQMPFVANEGQMGDEHVRFYATTFAGTVYVTDKGEMVYVLPYSEPRTGKRHSSSGTTKTWMIKEKLVG